MDEVMKCPRCGSELIEGGKKGFGGGKAIVGSLLLGPVGLAAGVMGKNKLKYTCLKCGNQWEPDKEWKKNNK